MIRTRTLMESRLVRDRYGQVTLEPVSVSQEIVYRDGISLRFTYDTRTHSEADVDEELDRLPTYISRLFRISLSPFSRQVWRRAA